MGKVDDLRWRRRWRRLRRELVEHRNNSAELFDLDGDTHWKLVGKFMSQVLKDMTEIAKAKP